MKDIIEHFESKKQQSIKFINKAKKEGDEKLISYFHGQHQTYCDVVRYLIDKGLR